MTPERHKQIELLFHSALELPPGERMSYLQGQCNGNESLLREVLSLIDCHTSGTFLDSPAVSAALQVIEHYGVLARGQRLGRYEIDARIGSGGMGIVYRARDTRLGRQVAIKMLLPTAADSGARTRLQREAEAIAKLQHPNVCSVFDFGEYDNREYLVMEYLEGETLAEVIARRVLTLDTAVRYGVEMLSALDHAHRLGIVHRDVKPRNIMITKAGVKLLDFGLASSRRTAGADLTASQMDDSVTRNVAGTLPYMAPEQVRGERVDTRTDIFAFGLVMYEALSGRRAFPQQTYPALETAILNEMPLPLSGLRPDVPSSLQQIVVDCLAKDPDQRWQNTGDLRRELARIGRGEVEAAPPIPLAAVLAAGQTPSPQTVAAAGSNSPLQPTVALAVLVSIGIGLAALLFFMPKSRLSEIPLQYPPEVLTAKAREIVRSLGYDETPTNSVAGFQRDIAYYEYVKQQVSSRNQRKPTLPGSQPWLSFWYRQGPIPLVSEKVTLGGNLRPDDRFPSLPGMVSAVIDTEGRLLRFMGVPDLKTVPGSLSAADWSEVFKAAGLELSTFRPSVPGSNSTIPADQYMAWTGPYPKLPEINVSVEAAAFRGKLVYFEVVWPWARPESEPHRATESPQVLGSVFRLILLAAAGVLAHHNWKTHRWDGRGAWRIGLAYFAANVLDWILGAHFDSRELSWPYPLSIMRALYSAAVTSMVYIAVEPWVRRRWPNGIVTWSRILAGRWRDPVVGRDALFGLLAAVALGLVSVVFERETMHLGMAPLSSLLNRYSVGPRDDFTLSSLMGFGFVLRTVIFYMAYGISSGMALFLLLFLFRVLFRNHWLSFAAMVILPSGTFAAISPNWTASFLTSAVAMGVFVALMMYFGLFATIVAVFSANCLDHMLVTTDFTVWYGQGSLVGMAAVTITAFAAFRISLGGRRLWNDSIFEE